MRCCTSARGEGRRGLWANLSLPSLLAAWLLVLAPLVQAQTPLQGQAQQHPAASVQVKKFELSSEADGLYLSAQLSLVLSTAMVDALNKGVPLYFLATAQVVKERWYWRDAVLVQANRHLRLVYQPLTRRWRVNASASPLATSGLGVSLSQHFDNLDEALASMGRFAHWGIASAEQLARLEGHNVQFSFEIDNKQLPRPFLIGPSGNVDWTLGTSLLEAIPAKTSP
jgi:hypothetical protein